MVKLQPSKLIMRVRFPLPAYLNQHTRMKKVLSMVLLAGVLSGSVYAADVQSVAAVAATSGVSIDALSVAVYEAVKASPQDAVTVFESVMKQRESWSVTETYAVLRAVLLASPSLESSFVQAVTGSQSSAGTQGQMLLSALYEKSGSVAAAVVQGVVGSSVAAVNAGASAVMDAYVPVPPTVSSSTPEYSVTPTPPPTSSNN